MPSKLNLLFSVFHSEFFKRLRLSGLSTHVFIVVSFYVYRFALFE